VPILPTSKTRPFSGAHFPGHFCELISAPAGRTVLCAIPGVTTNVTQSQAEIPRPYARVAYQGQPERSLRGGCFSRAFLVPRRHIVYQCFPFSPIAHKHRERQRGCALRLCGLLLRCRAYTGFGSSHFAGTLQESRPWHLGAALRSRPPGGVP
jgi:hypothetical protein